MNEARVFVVDDDISVRSALNRLLKSAGFEVETFPSADAYLAREAVDGPGCLVLDIRMKGVSGMELQDALAARPNPLPIIFLTGHGDIQTSVRAMKNGALDFLTKPVDESRLLPAVEAAVEQSKLQVSVRRRVAALTDRECEVMQCVLTGALNKQIADHLGISEKTVKVHRGRVMFKMQVSSVAELIRACDLACIAPARMHTKSGQ